MTIKATNIANLTDARYFAAFFAEYLGFDLNEHSDNYVEPTKLNEFREWVEGPKIVGEFGQSDLEIVKASIEFFKLDAVEIDLLLAKDHLEVLGDIAIIGRLSTRQPKDVLEAVFSKTQKNVRHYILEVEEGYTDLEQLAAWCRVYPILLEFEGTASDYVFFWEKIQPAGFSFIGGEEEKVGVKSFDDLEACFDALEPFREF